MFSKKTKTFLLLTLVFIAIMGVSAVSAADDNNFTADTSVIAEDTSAQAVDNSIPTTDVSTKNIEINKKLTENVKGDGESSFADLTTDIAGSDVTLAKDYKQGSEETNITIAQDKTIDGAGHTITATNGTFIINDGVTLTLKNLNIVSHHGADYKTYYWDLYNNGNLIVNNVTFKYDSDLRTYGGFIWTGANTNVTIQDSVFDGEHTVRSQVYADGVNAVVKIDNCKFINYNASNAAVGMNKKGNLTVTNSYFANNLESSYGGAIYVNDNNVVLVVDHCKFENLVANYRGGAIYSRASLSMIQHNTFKNLSQKNKAYNAGILFLDNSAGYLYLDNNTAENVVAEAADFYISGGKLYTPLYVTGENVSVDQEASTTIKFEWVAFEINSVTHVISYIKFDCC